MTSPELALERARQEVVRRRDAGEYADDLGGFRIEPVVELTTEKLLEWALIEPDIERVYSTRRWGRPITAFKRALIWATRQYHGQVYGEQTRFNHHVTIYAGQYRDRVRELEQEVARLSGRLDRLERSTRDHDPPDPA
ncbi:MAG TPA: hypothetical protein VHE14_06595 [Solirubrobacteraceae bacterium]|nr:hypothetical protein [Solirubrobacteraceae bacterium]